MSRQSRCSEDRKKAPVIAPSRVDSSSNDDDNISASEQVALVRKIGFASHTIPTVEATQGSTLFIRDNILP